MSELEELKLAYAECSRQKMELLIAHKKAAALTAEKDCRTCRSVVQRNGTGCGSIVLCTNADRYEAMRPVNLWTTI